ncbi:MAG: hypothetical protein M9893_01220 [Pyrinomonadaceae bacterium]|nr:hypothetical protein [Pyrinomonadaceae bacterium]
MMQDDLSAGDFLVFQLESGFGLLRLLAVDSGDERVWHVAGYRDFFPDVDSAEAAAHSPSDLTLELSHAALTERAFGSTEVARLINIRLSDAEIEPLDRWRSTPDRTIYDRSVRLLMGFR